MSTDHLRDLHDALVDFYAPGLTAETLVERTFALTARLLSFSLNSYGVIDTKTGILTANFDCDPPGLDDAFAAFGRHMGQYAAFRFDPSVNGGKPFSARDFYSWPALQDLDIYQEVYRPLGYTDHCFVHIPAGPDRIVFTGLIRDGRPFNRADKQLLELLQPHLANGLALARAVTAASDTPSSPESFARAGFTPRESDVLFWLTQGKANEDIAKILSLRADSVSRYLRTIYEKLGVEHRVAAVIRALDLARRLHAETLPSLHGEPLLRVGTR